MESFGLSVVFDDHGNCAVTNGKTKETISKVTTRGHFDKEEFALGLIQQKGWLSVIKEKFEEISESLSETELEIKALSKELEEKSLFVANLENKTLSEEAERTDE
nr:hypothetical protein MarFTME_305 [Marseillevirus futianmevirus]